MTYSMFWEVLRRYRKACSCAWRHRSSTASPKRSKHEVQFLPAALALQEKPAHPVPRFTACFIVTFGVLGLFWASVGEIDVVATATGKIIPSGKSKFVQANETAVIKSIRVEEGAVVKAGDVLVELESEHTGADVNQINGELLAAQINSARARAFLESIDSNSHPLVSNSGISLGSLGDIAVAQQWLDGQYFEYKATIDQATADLQKNSAEIQSARIIVDSLKESLPIVRRVASDLRELAEGAYVPRHSYLEKERIRIEQERTLNVQLLKVDELLAVRNLLSSRLDGVKAQTRRSMLDLQNQSDQRISSILQELKKAKQRHRLRQLRAPVDGTVQQLSVHTPGGVVTPAQILMIVVPTDQPLEVEVYLENKDVGFVRSGQNVEVKVDAFDFVKYGIAKATVISVSGDAIEHDKLGLVYSAKLELVGKRSESWGDGGRLAPGMSVRAEIITDKRTVLSYFLSPFKVYVQEGFRER